MRITFPCRCGQRLQARDEDRGKKVRCPSCSAIVHVPKSDQPDAEVYALAAPPNGTAREGVVIASERRGAPTRENSPQQTDLKAGTWPHDGASSPGTVVNPLPGLEREEASLRGVDPPDNSSPLPFVPPPPLPGESRRERRATRANFGDSKVRRLASRVLTVVGWLCIAVAGLQFSVFAGAIAWSFKSGHDVAAHDARIREVEEQIAAQDAKILGKLAGPLAHRHDPDDEIDGSRDVGPARGPQPRMADPGQKAREDLRDELLRLRFSKPTEFTLTAAFTTATGFAVLLFWLAATSGLLSGSMGCLLLRLPSR